MGKKVKAQDPNARQTRSGRQPISLQKKVHKANLARTTITLTQGTRRSERSVTQISSTSSLEKARKTLRQSTGTAGSRKRKRSDSSSSEEDAEDVSYGTRRRSRTKTSKKTKQRQSAGSDSSLTDVETLDRSVELGTSGTAQDGSVEDDIVLPPSSAVAEAALAIFSTAMAEGAEPAIQETVTGNAATMSSSAEAPASEHQHAAMPQPDLSSIAEDAETLSQVTSTNDAVVTNTPGTPPTTGSTFGIQLAALAGSAKAIFFRGLQGASENPAPIASDTASQSQSSVFDQDEEQKN